MENLGDSLNGLGKTLYGDRVSEEDFEQIKVIGQGSFGKVKLVRLKRTGQVLAMKILKKSVIVKRNQLEHTITERKVLGMAEHPFLVQMHFAFQTDKNLYLVLDFAPGGELFFHLSRMGFFHEDHVKFYAAEIVAALAFVHKRGIIYRDLKPENILLSSKGHVCLTDFGLAKELTFDDRTNTFCGTPEYIAPEILVGEGYALAVDWWSLGTLMYEMMTGLPPFFSDSVSEMYELILSAEVTFPDYISAQGQSLLRGLLIRDPVERLGGGEGDADEIKAHPFFSSINWDDLEALRVPPPFVPELSSDTDTRYFEAEFLQLSMEDTPSDGSVGSHLQKAFENFSFTNHNFYGGGGGKQGRSFSRSAARAAAMVSSLPRSPARMGGGTPGTPSSRGSSGSPMTPTGAPSNGRAAVPRPEAPPPPPPEQQQQQQQQQQASRSGAGGSGGEPTSLSDSSHSGSGNSLRSTSSTIVRTSVGFDAAPVSGASSVVSVDGFESIPPVSKLRGATSSAQGSSSSINGFEPVGGGDSICSAGCGVGGSTPPPSTPPTSSGSGKVSGLTMLLAGAGKGEEGKGGGGSGSS